MRLALLSALVLALACSSNPPPAQPGGPDAGGAEDSGTGGPDAGREDDGGTPPGDAGTDAGTGADAGAGTDAGTGADGGVPDGGGCVAPAPVTGTVLVPGLTIPRRLAVDATHVYISEAGSLRPEQERPAGRLLRLARSGGAVTEVATGFLAPDALAVDEDSVYVLDMGGLWRVDKATGMKDERPLDATVNNTIIGGTEVRRATLEGRDVLVVATSERRLVRVDTDGNNPQELYTGTGFAQVRGARVVGPEVYFLVTGTNPGLYRVPLDGSRAAELVDGTVSGGSALEVTPEVTPTHFLITLGGEGTGEVWRLPRDGGTAQVLARGLQGPLFPVELNGTVYFKDRTPGGASTGFLRRVRTCAPGTSDAVGPTGAGPGGLLVDLDGNTLFYTSQESGTGGAVGTVP